jgi:hypothetical protein
MGADDSDWNELREAWKGVDQEAALSRDALLHKLRQRRALIAVQSTLELAGFVAALLVAFWARRHSPAAHLGNLLLGWSALQGVFVLWLRWRERRSDTTSVLDGVEVSIERDEHLDRSMRLGNAVSMLALICVLLATAQALFGGMIRLTPALLTALVLLAVYVFGVQVLILLWTRRVRRRRQRFEDIKRALEVSHPSPAPPGAGGVG